MLLPLARHRHGPQAPALAQYVRAGSRRCPRCDSTAAPSLDVLGGLAAGLNAAPEADGDDGGEGEEDAESNAQAPDGLDLVAGDLVGIDPLEDVALGVLDVVVEGVDEVGRVTLARVRLALHVADGLADKNCDNNDHDEHGSISASGNEHGKHRVPVKNVVDDNVDCSKAGLVSC